MSCLLSRGRHLTRRFLATVRGREPLADDLEWAATVLTPAEMTLFDSMSSPDQAHAIEVGRFVQATLRKLDVSRQSGPKYGSVGGSDRGDWALAAALMHDIGKVEASAGVALRVVSTLIGGVVGDSAALRLSRFRGPVGRLGRHLRYPILGASLLGAVGSHELVRAWAAEHHCPPDEWTVPHDMGVVLRDADNAAG